MGASSPSTRQVGVFALRHWHGLLSVDPGAVRRRLRRRAPWQLRQRRILPDSGYLGIPAAQPGPSLHGTHPAPTSLLTFVVLLLFGTSGGSYCLSPTVEAAVGHREYHVLLVPKTFQSGSNMVPIRTVPLSIANRASILRAPAPARECVIGFSFRIVLRRCAISPQNAAAD